MIGPMRPRRTTLLYQTASRIWLTLAGLSLLLPADRRLGIWLPLHLALAGSASIAISGAMQNFTLALTATDPPPERWVWAQFSTMNLGVALIALGRPLALPGMVAAGGASFVVGAVILFGIVRRARRRALFERHRLPVRMYELAVVCVIAGAFMGALIGSGAVHDVRTYTALRHAHMTINVLAWVSLTIVATLVTLLPSILRVKMPSWRGAATAWLLGGGAVAIAAGLALDATAVTAVGGLCELAGAAGVAWMVLTVLRSPRRWPIAASALHLVAGVAWFAIGSLGLANACRRGVVGFDAFAPVFLVIFVGGWIVQVLLGAWTFLLPMARPGHPDVRRSGLIAIEFAAWIQLCALNAGIALMAADAAGWVGPPAGAVGIRVALLGGAIALVKAWAFPALGAMGLSDGRAQAVWQRPEPPASDVERPPGDGEPSPGG
jgi:nitrite reductase (NO-forming)